MEKETFFDEIRPYNDSEVHSILKHLIEETSFNEVIKYIFPEKNQDEIKNILLQIKTIQAFQHEIIQPIVLDLAKKSTSSVNISGIDKIKQDNNLYISNHRDIILDSAFLSILLIRHDKNTCNIAIGNNLFVKDWVEPLVRINRSIVVKRNIPIRQMIEASSMLSAYIRYAIVEKKESVWLAQREGRAKDSNDRTQQSLIKMLNMSGEENFVENMATLNICPLSISYEYDPCDYLKAKEFQQKRDNPDYKKTPQDDALNMMTGLHGWKGEVHYEISDIKEDIEFINKIENKNEQISALAEVIDKKIHSHYKIYAVNKIAHDLLLEKNSFEKEYTDKQQQEFETYIQQQINKIDLQNKDVKFLRNKILEMYANPLINFLQTKTA